MSKVGIADLKANLSKHLRWVRSGRTITVLDREIPIADIVPHESVSGLRLRKALRTPSSLKLPPPPHDPTDSLAVLLEDRGSR